LVSRSFTRLAGNRSAQAPAAFTMQRAVTVAWRPASSKSRQCQAPPLRSAAVISV
jgi:hypothetical protein